MRHVQAQSHAATGLTLAARKGNRMCLGTVFQTLLPMTIAVSLASHNAQAQTLRNGFFCQVDTGAEEYFTYAAVREVPDGDVQFSIHKWGKEGLLLALHGIALGNGNSWIYKERAREYYTGSEDPIVYHADTKPKKTPTCKLTITWAREQGPHFDFDPVAKCDNRTFVTPFERSTRFGSEDFRGPVADELDDRDKFGPRCADAATVEVE